MGNEFVKWVLLLACFFGIMFFAFKTIVVLFEHIEWSLFVFAIQTCCYWIPLVFLFGFAVYLTWSL